jgi:hypothetical protein
MELKVCNMYFVFSTFISRPTSLTRINLPVDSHNQHKLMCPAHFQSVVFEDLSNGIF